MFKKFDKKQVVYKGYVDDPRNTDNAWMETTAIQYHASLEFARVIGDCEGGDDATESHWFDIDNISLSGDVNDGKMKLYADHSKFVNEAVKNLRAGKFLVRTNSVGFMTQGSSRDAAAAGLARSNTAGLPRTR